MNRATPRMRNFAGQIIAHEAKGRKSSAGKFTEGFTATEKLRPQLTTLMGNAGFRALQTRALALAGAEVFWLRVVQIESDGTLAGLDEPQAQLGADKFLEGRVVLLAHLLGLLAAFIGENLVVRLVREVWPNLAFSDQDFGNGDKNEKAS